MKLQMEDSFLDEVMSKVQQVDLHYYENLEACYSRNEVVFKLQPAVEYLLTKGYITSRLVGSQKYLDISPEGVRLQEAGGFLKATKEKEDLLRYAKGSHDYARKAFYAAAVAVAIAIIAIIVSILW